MKNVVQRNLLIHNGFIYLTHFKYQDIHYFKLLIQQEICDLQLHKKIYTEITTRLCYTLKLLLSHDNYFPTY